MKIAWIDHTIGSNRQLPRVMKESGLELFGASNWQEFKHKYGDINDYDGLMWHAEIGEFGDFIEDVLRYKENKPTILLSNYSEVMQDSQFSVFSYRNFSGIIEYFLQRQTPPV